MSLPSLCIRRPVATALITLGLTLAGLLALFLLPVSPLPRVDFPTITVQAALPGASPETMSASVARPLERHLGQIANVTEMTSTSSLGSSRIVLQFGLDRDIDGAARDVQAAINAARADLPVSLRGNPWYRQVNPGDAPILVLALTSATRTREQIYDTAATILQQRLSQVRGVGQVSVGGTSPPAIRVEINPDALFQYRISLEDIRAAIAAANANSPKGAVEDGDRRYEILSNDRTMRAEDFQSLIVAFRNGAPVRLTDVAQVVDSVEDTRNIGLANGEPAVLLILNRRPGANIIDTVDRVKALLPQLEREIPRDVDILLAADRTETIRASLHAAELALVIAIGLVIAVVLVFLRDARAAWIPAVAVPVSLIATFGAMYLLDYSLNNLTLMALIIATGFVVDDAVVVLENISRHVENGMGRVQAAIVGAREVSFTVVSMSVSLIAVFIPILFMGGIIGRLFHEFAMTITIAILISLVVSLSATPMMSALLLRPPRQRPANAILSRCGSAFDALARGYRLTLDWALAHPRLVMASLLAVIGLTIHLYVILPKGFFPQQDTGRLFGAIRADQNISFEAMRDKLTALIRIIHDDPAVASVVGFNSSSQAGSGFIFVSLKDRAERKLTADEVMARLRREVAAVPGATLVLQSVQDFRAGGRPGNAQFQYTLLGDDREVLRDWSARLANALKAAPELIDVDSDQEDRGLESVLEIDRDTASRLGVNTRQISNTLYSAFGQRQVSVIYGPRNQYYVVMEAAAPHRRSPEALRGLYIGASGGGVAGTQATNAVAGTVSDSSAGTADAEAIAGDAARNQRVNRVGTAGRGGVSSGAAVSTGVAPMIPLAAFGQLSIEPAPLAINHQGHFVATTLSFNLPPGGSLGEAVTAIQRTMVEIGVPATIQGGFQGTAKIFRDSLANQPLLIVAAIVSVYMVLGILYESYVHPLTILSTLPSAGAGATLALLISGQEFSLIALVAVILLIGIVKKNAIMMVDFALAAEKQHGLSPRAAIREACLQRFRPIMMTTMAAMLGALPLALDTGSGGELRQPLGIAVVGGLLVSQALTLYTTPVVYLYLDRLRRRRPVADINGDAPPRHVRSFGA
ncbi:MAG: efflux RND transporter permease subunit [Rhodospirillales bacterium]|nr:efflux RND transporter permease subunit [Rhodospirillales bacterium]